MPKYSFYDPILVVSGENDKTFSELPLSMLNNTGEY